jgi:hypothetical protein
MSRRPAVSVLAVRCWLGARGRETAGAGVCVDGSLETVSQPRSALALFGAAKEPLDCSHWLFFCCLAEEPRSPKPRTY